MKIVGAKNRDEFELDPQKAYLRGRELDAMYKSTLPPYPRGVWRLTHEKMNEMDLARQVEQFKRINHE